MKYLDDEKLMGNLQNMSISNSKRVGKFNTVIDSGSDSATSPMQASSTAQF